MQICSLVKLIFHFHLNFLVLLITGVVATRNFSKGDIVCDYHGRLISAAEGRKMMKGVTEEAKYLFFYRDLCIDAQTFPCRCHPDKDTLPGRILNLNRCTVSDSVTFSTCRPVCGTNNVSKLFVINNCFSHDGHCIMQDSFWIHSESLLHTGLTA